MAVLINGAMMKAVRGQRRLSQQQLAEKSRVGIATIKRIEGSAETYGCQSTSALRLASALQVEIEDLCADTFQRVIDIGGDLELHLDRYVDPDTFRQQSERVAALLDARNRVLKK